MPPRVLSLAVAACVAVSAPSLAASVVGETLEQMSKSAPVIVRGSVVAVQTRWDDGHRRIWTYAEVKVSEALKGRVGATVVVRTPQGVVGEVGQEVAGAPKFALGEDCVLFLEGAPDDATSFNVYSLAAGKFSLVRRLGTLRAVRDLDGLALYPRAGVKIWQVDAKDLGDAGAFLARVRAAAGGAR